MPRRCRSCRGFTLLEAAFTVTIIGVGVLAMVEAQASFVRGNLWSSHASTGVFLATELREYTRGLPRHDPVQGLSGDPIEFGPESGETTIDDLDDVDDFDGLVFGAGGDFAGPIDAFGRLVPEIANDGSVVVDSDTNPIGMVGWTQEMIVEKVEPFDTSVVRDDGYYRVPADSDDADAPVGTDGTSEPPLEVDEFPLRVRVIVRYTPQEAGADTMVVAEVSWIVP